MCENFQLAAQSWLLIVNYLGAAGKGGQPCWRVPSKVTLPKASSNLYISLRYKGDRLNQSGILMASTKSMLTQSSQASDVAEGRLPPVSPEPLAAEEKALHSRLYTGFGFFSSGAMKGPQWC